ncbi:MAG: hypothetical protein JSU95_14325 [Betaproteobacteria bacterium]|nr:MAG: hypothetical protein JSU95_14325 [Betaproteobacteria bacterium]
MNKRTFMILLAASVATGCAPQPTVTYEPLPQLQIVETLETDADRLLDYYAYMTELQGDTLEREYTFVEKAYTTDPNEYNQMQLIMLLASPRASFRNTDLAHAMVKEWLQDEYYRYSKLRPLAMLYDNYLSELKRQGKLIDQATEDLQQSDQKLRQANERSAKQAQEIKASQQRSKELQDKLDALLEMERSLIEREEITQPDKQ